MHIRPLFYVKLQNHLYKLCRYILNSLFSSGDREVRTVDSILLRPLFSLLICTTPTALFLEQIYIYIHEPAV